MSEAFEVTQAPEGTRTLTLSRNFAVPVQRLFDAWADPEQTCRWMGPRNTDCRVDEWDFRVGGNYVIVMISDEGNEFPAHGVFQAIDRPNRLAMTWAWQHEDFMQGIETLLDLEFVPAGDGASELRLTHALMPDEEQAGRHAGGWTSALECLADYLNA